MKVKVVTLPDKELIGWMEVHEALEYLKCHSKTVCIAFDGDEPPEKPFLGSIEFEI